MISPDSILRIRDNGLDTNWIMSSVLDAEFYEPLPDGQRGVIFTPDSKDEIAKSFGENVYTELNAVYNGCKFEGCKTIAIEHDGNRYSLPLYSYKEPEEYFTYLLMDFQHFELEEVK